MKYFLLKVLKNKIFCTKPYEKPFSKEFLLSSRLGDIEKAKNLLHVNKYLVYDFDNVYLF